MRMQPLGYDATYLTSISSSLRLLVKVHLTSAIKENNCDANVALA